MGIVLSWIVQRRKTTYLWLGKQTAPILSMDGTTITPARHHKHLGVFLSNDLSWDHHISFMIPRVIQRCALLKFMNKWLPPAAARHLYTSYVRPTLEYCSAIWHFSLSAKDTLRLERSKLVSPGVYSRHRGRHQRMNCSPQLTGPRFAGVAASMPWLPITVSSPPTLSYCASVFLQLLHRNTSSVGPQLASFQGSKNLSQ